MVAAARADGAVAPAEISRLRDKLAECAVFTPLAAESVEALLGEALAAAPSEDHLADIARALPSRAERVLAYALACDVCAVDEELAPGELAYLESLRRALFLPRAEARDVLDSVRTFAGAFAIEEQLDRIRAGVPAVLDAMALMALADGRADEREAAAIAALLRASADSFAYDAASLRGAVDEALARVAASAEADVLARVAQAAPAPADRFWTLAYVQVVMHADEALAPGETALLESLRRTFGLGRDDVDDARALARQLAAAV
jgi:uncharacterized membrane protein YebE (DUF533 family)